MQCAGGAGPRPVPPMNLLGDMGGGATYLAFGIVCALLEARTSGQGQVIDAAIVDGTASLMNYILGMRAAGTWPNEPGHNRLDTGAPYYEVYTCADGKEISVGALEPQFYDELVRLSEAGAAVPTTEQRHGPSSWADDKHAWAQLFATRTRDEWTTIFAGTDACTAPVLAIDEALADPHLRARGTYVEHHGIPQAAPAPRFSRTEATLGRPPARAGEHTDEILREAGYRPEQISDLRATGALGG
jgi:alpha-methylacyl-CoA racemase